MYIIASFGFLLAFFSVCMITRPASFADGIIRFSKMAWFHPFEIVSRILYGSAIAYFSGQTSFPRLFMFIGIVLIAVGFGLLFTPPSKHREYAVWSAERFRPFFRPVGCISIFLAAFLIYAAMLA